MSKRPQPTLVDYVITAVGPAMIIVLLASMLFFLVEVFYQGQYGARLYWVLGLFVMGVVLITRIAIEEDPARAFAYGAPLAVVTFLALQRFVEFGGLLAPVNPLVNMGMMALVWWVAHRLTWECSGADDQSSTTAGPLWDLIQRQWLRKGAGSQTDEPKTGDPFDEEEGPTASVQEVRPTAKSHRTGKAEPRRLLHASGVWVLYVSLVALPLFGLGELFTGASRLERRGWLVTLLALYLMSGFGLLLCTSFLNLRRYLRARHLSMPDGITAAWLITGTLIIMGVITMAWITPRPYPVYSRGMLLAWVKSPRTTSSPFAPPGEPATDSRPGDPSLTTSPSDRAGSHTPRDTMGGPSGAAPFEEAAKQPVAQPPEAGSGGSDTIESPPKMLADPKSLPTPSDLFLTDAQTLPKDSPRTHEPPHATKFFDRPQSPPTEQNSLPQSEGELAIRAGAHTSSGSGGETAARTPEKTYGPDPRPELAPQKTGKEVQRDTGGASQRHGHQPRVPSEMGHRAGTEHKFSQKSEQDLTRDAMAQPSKTGEMSPQDGGRGQAGIGMDRPPEVRTNTSEDVEDARGPTFSRGRGPELLPRGIPSAGGLFQHAGTLLRLLLVIMFLILGVYMLWCHGANVWRLFQNLWAILQEFWQNLWGMEPRPKTESSPPQPVPPRPERFLDLANPFNPRLGRKLTPDQLVVYIYRALEVWAAEFASPRQECETPLEFLSRLSPLLPEAQLLLRQVAELYARVAYGPGKLSTVPADDLQLLWNALAQRASQASSSLAAATVPSDLNKG